MVSIDSHIVSCEINDWWRGVDDLGFCGFTFLLEEGDGCNVATICFVFPPVGVTPCGIDALSREGIAPEGTGGSGGAFGIGRVSGELTKAEDGTKLFLRSGYVQLLGRCCTYNTWHTKKGVIG